MVNQVMDSQTLLVTFILFLKMTVAICSNCAQANISVMFLVTESINRPSLLLGWLARGW